MARLFKTPVTVEGAISTNNVISSTQSSGDEGGQIDLTKAATNTTLTTGVSIDVFQNKLRIFETGGTNRGYYIDISGGAASAGTNLVGGGSASNSFATISTPSGTSPVAASATDTLTLTAGTGVTITGTAASDSIAIATNATNSNTVSTIVLRDASGNFSAGTITANLTGTASSATAVTATVTGTNSADLVYGNMADNDQFRIRVGGTATNAGFVEIATADDGTEPIYVRQYTGVFTTLARTATLLDGSGNTSFPGSVTSASLSTAGGLSLTSTASTLSLNSSVGTGGQTLTSAGVGVTPTWATPYFMPRATGDYYVNGQYSNGTGPAGTSTTSMAYVAIYLPTPQTLTSLGFYAATTGTSAIYQLGLYSNNPSTNKPNVLLKDFTNGVSNQLTVSATGGQFTSGTSYTLTTPGWYWVGIQLYSATTAATFGTMSTTAIGLAASLMPNGTTSQTVINSHYLQTITAAQALPTTAGTVTISTAGAPKVFVGV